MRSSLVLLGKSVLLCAAVGLGGGCAAFRAKVRPVDVEKERHLRETYDYSDMRKVTEEVAQAILSSDLMARQAEPPVVMIAGVENRTKQYVDTKALTDRMRQILFDSGKMKFVNAERRDALMKEQRFHQENVTAETRAAMGRQVGARYMITGSFAEMEKESPRQVRVSKRKVNYYKLTMEITDLESGLIELTTEKEFAREARLPLIGW
ncbi:MAG: hypothetical protein FJ225_12070 [Lentisphaerae bacterium]|nr:hypothetical protein [Lentisphaerota bacterium]